MIEVDIFCKLDILIEPNLSSGVTLDFNEQTLKKIYNEGYKAVYSKINLLNQLSSKVRSNNSLLKLSSINTDSINIITTIISSKSSFTDSEISNNKITGKLSKNNIINHFSNLRQSNKYNNINFSFLKKDLGYDLIINLEKNHPIIINNIIIVGNRKTSEKFIFKNLDISAGDYLDYIK